MSDIFEKSEMKNLGKNDQKIQKIVNDKIPFFCTKQMIIMLDLSYKHI